MAHYRFVRSGADSAAAPVLDAICPSDRIACALAARLFQAAGRVEVHRGQHHVAIVLTTSAVMAELEAAGTSKRVARHRQMAAQARPDVVVPAELSA